MSACDMERLELFLEDALDEVDAARMLGHLGGCEACNVELGLLKEERDLFAARARAEASPLPELELPRAQAPSAQVRRLRTPVGAWVRSAGAIAAAALVLGTMARSRPLRVPSSSVGPICVDANAERRERWAEHAVDSTEAAVGACLLASPRSPSPDADVCL